MTSKASQSGFALLMSLVVITIVLAIGLTILNITMKQLSLSSLARESEVAIYAASTGLECAQYHLNSQTMRELWLNYDDDPDDTSAPALPCAGQASEWEETNHRFYTSPERNTFNYQYRYDLPTGQCTEISLHMIDASASGEAVEVLTNEGLDTLRCDGGNICTTIFARGYNRPCADRAALFTVQRELTLQL